MFYRYLTVAVNSSKKSPEVIQLLDMHTHFSSATPGTRVCKLMFLFITLINVRGVIKGSATIIISISLIVVDYMQS